MKSFISTLLVVFAVDLLATAGDVTLTWSSPVIPKLYSNDTSVNPIGRPISEDEEAWLASLMTIGAIIGPYVAGYISERFGRKIGLLSLALPHMVSLLTMAFSRNIYLFYFGRLFGGISTGGGYTLLPMYIAEISHESHRGMMSQTLNVFWAFGNFVPYAIGPYLSIMWFNIILACIPTTFFLMFSILGPETPYYLVAAGKTKEAEESLMTLRSLDEEGVKKELEHIKETLRNETGGHLLDVIKNKGLRRAFLVCVILVVSQELSGFAAVTFYLQVIFEAAHTKIASDISALIVGIAIFISSFFSPFLIDRLGRKILTVGSCFGMFVALSMLATFFYIENSTDISTDPIFWLPIFSLILYIFAFHFGIASVPWTLASELFPNNVKGVITPIITSSCWISSFLTTKFFNNMNDAMGIAGSFWFFAGCCACTGIYSILFVPETKGKSFNEIQDMLNAPRGKKPSGKDEI